MDGIKAIADIPAMIDGITYMGMMKGKMIPAAALMILMGMIPYPNIPYSSELVSSLKTIVVLNALGI
jgi:hypothetical protein